MESVLVESAIKPKISIIPPLIGENYETLLKDSINHFLQESGKEAPDFSGFRSVFFRLLQSNVYPPLEVIWFYSAVTFHESKSPDNGILTRVLAAKDLFQLLAACSASCSGVKGIALLAPVLFKLHYSIVELSSDILSPKMVKKVTREIDVFLEGILAYIGLYSSKDAGDANDGLLSSFKDLIRVWTLDGVDGTVDVRESLRVFFPLVSDEIRDGFFEEGCGTGFLAGVVIVEAFLLRLCLELRGGGERAELQEELRIWAVGSITGFRNYMFFEILLRVLLEPSLPVTSLLGSKDEALLREVLYDVVVLVEYAFLDSETALEQSTDCMKSLAITRLVVAHEAIQFGRANGNHTKAISYINAFSRSGLLSRLIKLVTRQIGMEKPIKPDVSTPQALLKWLVNLEDQGLGVFVNGISKLRTKLSFDESNVEFEHPIFKPDKLDDDLFYIDNMGEDVEKDAEDTEMQSMETALMAAARTMKFTANDGRRKRKERKEQESPVKFVKYRLHDSSVKANLPPATDGVSSGSEVENQASDEDMVDTE